MTTLYRGSHSGTCTPREGQCWTDDKGAAETYAAGGLVVAVEVALSELVAERCAGYNWNANETPADSYEFRAAYAARGVDVLIYDDADENGREHRCYRLVSAKAVAAFAAAL